MSLLKITPAALAALRMGNGVILDGVTLASDTSPVRDIARPPKFILGNAELDALGAGDAVEMVPDDGGEVWHILLVDIDPPKADR